MYKIEVISSGKYSNVVLGPRYSLTKKEVIRFAKHLDEVEADYEIYKFIRITKGFFCWRRTLMIVQIKFGTASIKRVNAFFI